MKGYQPTQPKPVTPPQFSDRSEWTRVQYDVIKGEMINESNTRTEQTFNAIKKFASSTSHNEYLDIILSEVALSLAVIADALMLQREGSEPDVRG